MQTYNVDFRTDADYAIRQFKARSPRHALKKAMTFYDERPGELMFESYDGGHPVNEIEVFGTDGGSVAVWRDNDTRRRFAAGDMLAALELCADCLAELARLDDGTPSISALDQARAAIAKAKGDPPKRARRLLPSNPEARNDDRAEWAGAACAFIGRPLSRARPLRRGNGGRTAMIACIRTVDGDRLYIDTEDLARARQHGRKLIPIRDNAGARVSRPGDGELMLHVDNIASGDGR